MPESTPWATDRLDNLARLAEAATPGPWYAHGPVFGPNPGAIGQAWGPNRRDDAKFIAAVNPAAILRLIEAARRAEDYNAEAERHAGRVVALEAQNEDLTADRDALAARLAAIKALADEMEQAGDPLLRLDRLRAALSAAPTDTTKEN